MDDLVTFETQEGGAQYLFVISIDKDFMKPLVSPLSYPHMTSFIAMVEISAGLPVLRTSASVIPARPSGGSAKTLLDELHA
jgi:hypothetical protein